MKAQLRIAAAAAVLSISTPASAVCDGCVVGAVGAAAITVTTAIAGAATAVVGSMATQTTLLVNEIAAASGATASLVNAGVGGAVIRSAELTAQTDARLAARVHEAKAKYTSFVTDPCAVVAASNSSNIGNVAATIANTMPGGGGATRSTTPQWLSSGALSGQIGKTNPGRVVMSVAVGALPPPETEVLATAASQFGCSVYAAPGTPRELACKNTNGQLWNPPSSPPRPNADVRAETLFDGPQASVTASVTRRTISGDEDAQAVAALMRNLVDPLPLRTLRPAEMRTDEGRRFLALQDVYNARVSVASQGLRDKAADITADKETIPMLQNLALNGGQRFANYTNQQLAKIKDPKTNQVLDWKTKGVSPSEMRALEAGRRYRNPDWYAFLAGASEKEQFIEMATIGATQVALQVETLEELKKMRAAISLQSTSQVRSEMAPSLSKQHASATR